MYVLWRLIVVLLLATAALSFAVRIKASNATDAEELDANQFTALAFENVAQLPGEPVTEASAKIVKRDTADEESGDSFWGWLTGRDKPDPCMMASVGGVVGGGALTGAFVGAGIGSIFTGPGAIIGAVVGGVAGLFGGITIGHRAGDAVCGTACGNEDEKVHCYDS